MKLLQQGNMTEINYYFNKYTHEKVKTRPGCHRIETLRETKCFISIKFNHAEQTVLIEGQTYKVNKLPGYTYKKQKGNNIGASSFSDFVEFIKESNIVGSVFHLTTETLLLKLSKNKFQTTN